MDFLDSKDFYYKIALVTLIVVFIEIVLGSYVKSIDAGLSCPDWPLCYGQIIPLNTTNPHGYTVKQIWSEYIHRVNASVVSLLLVFTAYLTFRHRNEVINNGNKVFVGQKRLRIMIVIILLLGLQIIFGGLTVLLDTNPEIVSTHLAIATLIFGFTILLITKINSNES